MSKLDMESRSLESSSDPHTIPVYIAPYKDRGDEVSLIDLWRVIARRKGIILLSFLASMVLVSAYIFFAEPSYRAAAYLLPPQQQQIQGLLIDFRGIEKSGLDIERYTPELVYDAFLENLKSRGLRREFFDGGNLVTHYVNEETDTEFNVDRIFDTKFNKSFQVQVDTQNPLFVTVSLAYSDPELVTQWLNQFVDFTNERTVHQLFSDVDSTIQAEIKRVRYQLASKLKLAEQRRHDRIISLQEALRVAKALGITEAGAFPMDAGKNPAGIAVNTAQVPLYMRGTKALETEITVLESRKSDEPFIQGLRDLQERLSFLEDLLVDVDKLSAVTVDAVAKKPYRAERPRKLLLIAIAAMLGFMIGIFLVFIAEFRSRVFDELENTKA